MRLGPRGVDLAWTLLLSLLLLGPLLLGTGYWLVGDMVFVPRQPWKPAWLGLDSAVPRAVPMDAVVSVGSSVLPGWVLQRTFLLAALLVGGLATGRLLGGHGAPARMAAIALVLWNPWLLERLLMGQWAIMAGGLLLPAVVLAAVRVHRNPAAAWPWLALTVTASAVCSPSSGLVAAGVALVVAGASIRSLLLVGVLGLAANATWLAPALTAPGARITTSGVFDLFAARAESSLGLLASLLSLGGTWKSAVVPSARTDSVLVGLACLLSLAALLGLRHALPRGGSRTTKRLVALGSVALGLALLPSLPGGTRLLEAAAEVLPAVSVLRDSHRYLAPLAVVLAVGLAGAVEHLVRHAGPGREWSRWVGGVLVLSPVLLLPQQAWGAAGQLRQADYPSSWQEVVAEVERRPSATTVVLPWTGSYRGFDWNGRRAVLDPAPRLLPGEVVVDDRTLVDGAVIPSEDPYVAAVATAVSSDDVREALLAIDVDLVLVETPARLGPADRARVAQLEAAGAQVLVEADELLLLDLAAGDTLPATGPSAEPGRPSRSDLQVVLVVAGHLGSAGLGLGAVAVITWRRRARMWHRSH